VTAGTRTLGWLLAACLAGACAAEPPSLVVVTLDTVRRDHVGAYGGARGLTPHLDALAQRGLVFEHAFTTMPTTGPAHASLFTGLFPSEHGSLANGEPVTEEAARGSLALLLRERGYASAAFVTTRLLAPAATGLPGFEVYDAPRGALRPGAEAVDAALAWLAHEPRRPVLLWVHLYDAHAPYGTPDEKRRGFPVDPRLHGFVDPSRFADPAERARWADRYAAGVREADAALGRLVAGLAGLLEPEPFLVVAADHGESLDEHLATRGYAFDHGEFLDEEVVRIPLVVAGPGVAAGRSRDAVSIRDLHPTLLGVAGTGASAGPGAGARDLRAAHGGPRVVAVERRRSGPGEPTLEPAHAAAAFDAENGVIVGPDGAPLPGPAPPDAELLAAARRHALGARPPAPRGAASPELAEALRSLGYAE
jgi:arylsulfatase A-like enzyme